MKKPYKIKRKGDSYVRDALIIFGITLVSGILMALVFQITLKPIERKTEEARQKAYQSVFPGGEAFQTSDALAAKWDEFNKRLEEEGRTEHIIKEILEVADKDGKPLGHVLAITTKEGYGGAISLTLGVDYEGRITGIEILAMSETPGLGAKAGEEGFLGQFKGLSAKELVVTKDGKKEEREIDAISGATITSKAVVGAVNTGLALVEFVNQSE